MKKKFLVGILAGTLFLSWGCQQQTEDAAADEGTEIGEAAEESSSTSTRSAKPKSRSKPKPVPTFTVPAGTTVSIRLMDPLDSGQNAVGDAFAGTLSAALKVGNQVVAPVGSTVEGEVTHVVNSGRLKKPAELSFVLTSLKPRGGKAYSLTTKEYALKNKSKKKRNVGIIGGGTAAGALIGGLAGGKKGALIGGALGAGGGTATAAATGKKEIKLAVEEEVVFTLANAVRLPASN